MTQLVKSSFAIGALMIVIMSPASIAVEAGFFQQETLPESRARVKTEHDLPLRTWDQACRSALLQPFRSQQLTQLESQSGTQLEGTGAYVSASVEGYRSYREDGWLYCSANTIDIDHPLSLAGTALREVWQGREHYGREVLVNLLQVALENPATYDDAVVFIASTTDASQQLQFLDDNLDPRQLKLSAAFESVFQMWLIHDRFGDVIQHEEGCDTVTCRRLIAQAYHLKEKDDAEKAYDLSSYF